MSLVTFERASALLRVDEGGHIYWRSSRSRARIGMPAGCLHSGGYRVVQVDGRLYLAHRLVWLLTHGSWPSQDIDHINGVRCDNRPDNLRDVDRATNIQNIRGPYSTSRTGLLGAYVCKATGGFQSSIHANGRTVSLGYFTTAEEAHAAYMKAKRELHPGYVQAESNAA